MARAQYLLWIVAAIFITLIASAALGYFFLFDDFALVGEARTQSVRDIWNTPLFGFYRPAVFLMVRAESALFGWTSPGGYLLTSQALHVVNACLVFALARKVSVPSTGATVAAVVFLLSPWSSESYFWLSSRFDVLCTTGVLGAVLSTLYVADEGPAARRGAWALTGLVFTGLAVFSKETGVMTTVVAAVMLLGCAQPLRRARLPLLGYLGAMAGVTAMYLVLRSTRLPAFDGAYGDFFSLIRGADLFGNISSYLRALVTFPGPWIAPGEALPLWVAVTAIAAGLVLVAVALRARPLLTTVLLAAFLCCVLPVAWQAVPAGSSAAGRFMYLPGVWFALCVGVAWNRLGAILALVVVLAWSAAALVSINHQAAHWRAAAELSRTSVQNFSHLVGSGVARVYVPNLPFWFSEGPYVLKDYAFRYFYEGQQVPVVRARAMALTRDSAGVRFAHWADESVGAPLAPDERVFTLPIAVAGRPQRLTLSAERITVNAGAGIDAAVQVEVVAEPATRWHVYPGPGVTVSPTGGEGASVVSVSALAGAAVAGAGASTDVRVCTDDDVVQCVTVDVLVRTVAGQDNVPPFGWVDQPTGDVTLGTTPISLLGWALDDIEIRDVWVGYRDTTGQRHRLGTATRKGERPDVTAVHPRAHDVLNSAWSYVLDPARLTNVTRPIDLVIVAVDAAGHETVIGTRVLR